MAVAGGNVWLGHGRERLLAVLLIYIIFQTADA